MSEPTEYEKDRAALDASAAAQHKSLADVLIELAEKAGIPKDGAGAERSSFYVDGWTVTVDFPQGIREFIGPDGYTLAPYRLPDCHDRTRLLAWRPSK